MTRTDSSAAPPGLLPAAVAGVVALFVPLFVPWMTGRLFTLDDLGNFHIPIRFLFSQALASGDNTTWTSALLSGVNLHGEGQLGLFHPLHAALYRVLSLETALTIEIVTSYAFGCAGMLLLLRRAGLSTAASVFGAGIFAFSGFQLIHLMHVNAIAICAHVPWMLMAADLIVTTTRRRGRLRGAIASAALFASAILLGYPQYVWIAAATVAGVAIARAFDTRSWRGLPWLAAGMLAGAALGAVQLLPTYHSLVASVRAESRLDFALSYSLHPLNLVQLWSPYALVDRVYRGNPEQPLHEFAVYDGAMCTLALCWLLVRWREIASGRFARASIALGALAVVLALGQFGGLYYGLASLPVFGWFRAPSRFLMPVHLGLAALAAVMLQDLVSLLRRTEPLPWRRLWPLGLPALLAIITAVAAPLSSRFDVGSAAIGLAMVASAGAIVALAARGKGWALVALPLVVAADLGVWGYSYVWSSPPASVEDLARSAERPPDGQPGETIFTDSTSNLPVLAGYRAPNGYVALVPARVVSPWSLTGQRAAGVAWRQTRDRTWERVPDPMPRVRLIARMQVSADPARELRTIDMSQVALVSRPLALSDGDPGDARLVIDRPGRIVVDATTTGAALLVTTEAWDAGWRATDETGPLEVERVNGDFLSAVVRPGRSRVTFTFEPPGLRAGAWISAVTLLLVGACLAVSFFLPSGAAAGPLPPRVQAGDDVRDRI